MFAESNKPLLYLKKLLELELCGNLNDSCPNRQSKNLPGSSHLVEMLEASETMLTAAWSLVGNPYELSYLLELDSELAERTAMKDSPDSNMVERIGPMLHRRNWVEQHFEDIFEKCLVVGAIV